MNARLVTYANERSHPESVRFVVADGDRLPFEDASFDGVLLNEVLEHVDDDAGGSARPATRGSSGAFQPEPVVPIRGSRGSLERDDGAHAQAGAAHAMAPHATDESLRDRSQLLAP
jgi:hypothetical protein